MRFFMNRYKYPILLTLTAIVMLILIIPQGSVFGSNGDWLSQHVSVADHFRKTFFSTGQLLPDYSTLGGGSNMFTLAYYGYLRPDVLLSYLLPGVPMRTIIIGYASAGMIAAVNLCYLWLRRQGPEPFFCFLGALLLCMSTCFYQFHHQIMFVNYLPFLFLALLGIDRYLNRQKTGLLIGSLFLIYMHSFYFSISCLGVCTLYFLHKSKSLKRFLGFAGAIALSIGMAVILLLPTGLALLEHTKDAGNATTLHEIFSLNKGLSTLLYNPYGCGLTIICLYTMLLSIKQKQTRFLGISVFLCLLLNPVSYLLNGTLYVREKSLIPFLPLVLLLCVKMLQKLHQREIRQDYLLALLSCLPLLFLEREPVIAVMIEGTVLLLWVVALDVMRLLNWPSCRFGFLILSIIPLMLSLQVAKYDEYLPRGDKRQALISPITTGRIYQQRNYRFDCYTEPFANVNFMPQKDGRKTSVYSSTTNTKYSTFFYDIMRNPISIRNRVALIPNSNIFFEYLMGVRYIQTTPDKVPYGYQVLEQQKDVVMAENQQVLPLAYVSTNLYAEKAFDKLSFPYTLDTISNNTVVADTKEQSYTSKIKETTVDYRIDSLPDTVSAEEIAGNYSLKVKAESKVKLSLNKTLDKQVLIVTFDVESPRGREITISINNIRNRLSSKKAPYPNQNKTFTYIISSADKIDCLNIILSKGNYNLKNIKTYTMDASEIQNTGIIPLDLKNTHQKEVLKGTVSAAADGYLVTSLPDQRGYTAYVDGKEADITVVNKAFVGLKLTKGPHDITIEFHAPGKKPAAIISLLAWIVFLLLLVYERKGLKWHEKRKHH